MGPLVSLKSIPLLATPKLFSQVTVSNKLLSFTTCKFYNWCLISNLLSVASQQLLPSKQQRYLTSTISKIIWSMYHCFDGGNLGEEHANKLSVEDCMFHRGLNIEQKGKSTHIWVNFVVWDTTELFSCEHVFRKWFLENRKVVLGFITFTFAQEWQSWLPDPLWILGR